MKRYIIVFFALLLLDMAAVYEICFVHIQPVQDICVVDLDDGRSRIQWKVDSEKEGIEYCVYASEDGEKFSCIGISKESSWDSDFEKDQIHYIKIMKKYMGIEGKDSIVFCLEEIDNDGEG